MIIYYLRDFYDAMGFRSDDLIFPKKKIVYLCRGMKYIALIFSLYFALLALLPCQDREDMMASITHSTFQKSHAPNDERGQETCPPFCTCSCCSTARHLTEVVRTEIFTKTIFTEYPHLEIPALQEQPINIWQPPQIS